MKKRILVTGGTGRFGSILKGLKTNYEMTLNDCIFGKNIKIKYFGSKIFNIKIPPKVPLHIPFVVKNYGLLDKTGQKRGNLLINLILKYPVISNSDSIKFKKLFVKNVNVNATINIPKKRS